MAPVARADRQGGTEISVGAAGAAGSAACKQYRSAGAACKIASTATRAAVSCLSGAPGTGGIVETSQIIANKCRAATPDRRHVIHSLRCRWPGAALQIALKIRCIRGIAQPVSCGEKSPCRRASCRAGHSACELELVKILLNITTRSSRRQQAFGILG
jgi:hypothetical protein